MMKKVLLVLLLAALAAGGWFYFFRQEGGAPAWQTAPITRGDLTQAVTATGTLNPVLNVQVGSQISGNIQKLYVDFNSPVKAGEVIAELDPRSTAPPCIRPKANSPARRPRWNLRASTKAVSANSL